MKTLIPLAVILAVSLVLAEEPPPPPPPGPGPPGPEPPGPEPPGPQPPGPQPPGDKHELQVSFKSSSLDLKKQLGGAGFQCTRIRKGRDLQTESNHQRLLIKEIFG